MAWHCGGVLLFLMSFIFDGDYRASELRNSFLKALHLLMEGYKFITSASHQTLYISEIANKTATSSTTLAKSCSRFLYLLIFALIIVFVRRQMSIFKLARFYDFLKIDWKLIKQNHPESNHIAWNSYFAHILPAAHGNFANLILCLNHQH